jgi:hypothetical protein
VSEKKCYPARNSSCRRPVSLPRIDLPCVARTHAREHAHATKHCRGKPNLELQIVFSSLRARDERKCVCGMGWTAPPGRSQLHTHFHVDFSKQEPLATHAGMAVLRPTHTSLRAFALSYLESLPISPPAEKFRLSPLSLCCCCCYSFTVCECPARRWPCAWARPDPCRSTFRAELGKKWPNEWTRTRPRRSCTRACRREWSFP